MSAKGPGEIQSHDGSNLRIGIVHGRWNSTIIEALVEGARKSLLASGVKDENIVVQSVPGSYELPFAVQRMYASSHVNAAASSTLPGATDLLDSASSLLLDKSSPSTPVEQKSSAAGGAKPSKKPFDAIIAIGVLIKGQTMHFEYIADTVSHALMRVQLDAGVPIVFGLLTVLTEEQGLARAGLGANAGHNHGEDWGHAAVELGAKTTAWQQGRFI